VRLLVIGGDRSGEYHARQLSKAVACGALPADAAIDVVSSAWLSRLSSWLRSPGPDDQLVPAPLMPHLLWEWLAAELGLGFAPPPRSWGLPYEYVSGGAVYISAAAWTCPATCVEPAHCPVLHAPRDWDLAELIEDRALQLGMAAAVFRCLHFAMGVATVPATDLVSARSRLGKLGSEQPVLVATTSRCHAAVGALAAGRLEPSG
jgi:hypothetical protein